MSLWLQTIQHSWSYPNKFLHNDQKRSGVIIFCKFKYLLQIYSRDLALVDRAQMILEAFNITSTKYCV